MIIMIKFKINQKKSKTVIMGSWSVKLLSRDRKTRTKTKINQQTIIKNYRKIKMGNVTPTMDHYPEMNRWEIPILNLICHVKIICYLVSGLH